MAHSLKQTFFELPLGERDAALASLIRSLGHDEHSLQVIQTAITDMRDPFSRLPIELLMRIFDYLHPFEVWSQRIVCRRWNAVLSSEKPKRVAIDRFATHSPADSALDTSINSKASQSLALALRHVLALRLARPFARVSFPGKLAFSGTSSPHPTISPIQLNGRRIAYLRGSLETSGSDAVIIRDLVSGEVTILCGRAREKIMGIALTTNIVAFVTFAGTLYIASLLALTESLTPVRLPSSSIAFMAADGGLVICVLQCSHPTKAVMYSSASRKSNDIVFETANNLDRHMNINAVSVNSRDRTIDVSGFGEPNKNANLRVLISRYSLAGEHIAQVKWEQQVDMTDTGTFRLGSMWPTGEQGLHRMELSYYVNKATCNGRSNGMRVYCSLLYDEVELSLKAVDLAFSKSPRVIREVVRPVLWKDRMYYASTHFSLDACITTDVRNHRGDPKVPGPHTLRRLDDQHVNTRDLRGSAATEYIDRHIDGDSDILGISPDTCHVMVAMNDTFMVTIGIGDAFESVEVACLDERVTLHGSEKTIFWDKEYPDDAMEWDMNSTWPCRESLPSADTLDERL